MTIWLHCLNNKIVTLWFYTGNNIQHDAFIPRYNQVDNNLLILSKKQTHENLFRNKPAYWQYANG
jgi:hypothetical protein